jgi:hypothetical protein
MKSLKKRVVVGITLLLLLIATIVPVGAEDTTTSTTPSPIVGTGVVTVQLNDGYTMSFTLPIRCGNNC